MALLQTQSLEEGVYGFVFAARRPRVCLPVKACTYLLDNGPGQPALILLFQQH